MFHRVAEVIRKKNREMKVKTLALGIPSALYGKAQQLHSEIVSFVSC